MVASVWSDAAGSNYKLFGLTLWVQYTLVLYHLRGKDLANLLLSWQRWLKYHESEKNVQIVQSNYYVLITDNYFLNQSCAGRSANICITYEQFSIQTIPMWLLILQVVTLLYHTS